MAKIERVTEITLEKIFKDQRFIAGLDEALKISKRGYETSFSWYKLLFQEIFLPDTEILIGDENSVGTLVGRIRLEEEYYKTTGKIAPEEGTENKEFANFIKHKTDLGEGDFTLCPGYEEWINSDLDSSSLYPLLHVHTHPSEHSFFPSYDDFKHLIYLQNFYRKYYGTSIKPIGMVVNTKKGLDGVHHICLYRGNKPILKKDFFLTFIFSRANKNLRKHFHNLGIDISRGTYYPLIKEIEIKADIFKYNAKQEHVISQLTDK